ncbi:MAG: tetratricopeptide repeat protein [Helicobacteraceae bacterium]|jgi:tetratricopeptide (TPR) repeat protein|nr:tetratricopeptide repeat protein [Helicobacteraceae bacterium]
MNKFLSLFLVLCTIVLAFDSDFYEIMSSDAEDRGDYKALSEYRKALYENEQSEENKNAYFEALLRSQQNDRVLFESVKFLLKGDDKFIRRARVFAYYGKGDYERAIREAKVLVEKSASAEDYNLLGDLYLLNKDAKNALLSFNQSYKIAPNEQAVDKIAETIMSNNGEAKEAIAYYETHIAQYGCSNYLCLRLANLYAKTNNINGLIATYKRFYDQTADETFGKRLVELFFIKKDYNALEIWLEETAFNDEILLELYKRSNKLEKGSKLAKELYEKNGKLEFLAQSAMLEYESQKTPSNDLVDRTIRTLENVITRDQNHTYLNYLGYLLIDHDRDLKRGMELVRKALKSDPKNPYYLDSLAWGYYKAGEYEKAFKTISKLKKKYRAEPIVKEHIDLIQKARKNAAKKQTEKPRIAKQDQ